MYILERPKKVNFSKDGVTCDKGTDTDVYGSRESLFKEKDTRVDYGSCSEYEKWDVLTKLKA